MPLPPMATTDSAAASARRFAVASGVLSQYIKSGAGPVPLPMSPSSNAAHEGSVQQPDGAQQLTIFYGGRVVVLDACTPGRATELIRYATAAVASPVAAPALVDMPIARKASLKRFLSKRKDRSAADVVGRWEESAAPDPPKKGKTEASSWLALGSLGDMHAQ